jgi:hypothetical protein
MPMQLRRDAIPAGPTVPRPGAPSPAGRRRGPVGRPPSWDPRSGGPWRGESKSPLDIPPRFAVQPRRPAIRFPSGRRRRHCSGLLPSARRRRRRCPRSARGFGSALRSIHRLSHRPTNHGRLVDGSAAKISRDGEAMAAEFRDRDWTIMNRRVADSKAKSHLVGDMMTTSRRASSSGFLRSADPTIGMPRKADSMAFNQVMRVLRSSSHF